MNFPLSVTAPLSDFAIAAPVVGGEVLHASGKAGRIMIVDDEIANVLVAKKYLERAGYRSFETTTDSSTALNLIFSTKPDVLLLDINMPEIDGIQILKEIRFPKLTNGQWGTASGERPMRNGQRPMGV